MGNARGLSPASLLAVSYDGEFYVPIYGGNGNIVGYVDESGAFAVKFEYDPYGDVVSIEGGPSAPMPSPDGSPVPIPVGRSGEDFSFGFSTKYHDREVGLVAYQLRSYSPVLGRWLNRDPIEEEGGANLYGFVNNTVSFILDVLGLWNKYSRDKYGEPTATFDEDFVFNPSLTPSAWDYAKYVSWKYAAEGVKESGELEDAIILYLHYLDASGTEMTIDFEKAYREDKAVRKNVDIAISTAQRQAEILSKKSYERFFMTSGLKNVDSYPVTENWQKALGGFQLWGEAEVERCGERFSMNLVLHEIDRYNFDKKKKDIVTGIPDYVNGRFAELGWAHSFITKGEISVSVSWEKGKHGDGSDFASKPSIGGYNPRVRQADFLKLNRFRKKKGK